MSEVNSAGQQRIDYMNLLVTQLQNQNPLEPMDNQNMAAQLAQFTQLEESEKMNASLGTLNSTFSQVLQNSELEYARGLLGSNVSFEVEGETVVGSVQEVDITDDGIVLTTNVPYPDENGNIINGYFDVELENIKSVINPQL